MVFNTLSHQSGLLAVLCLAANAAQSQHPPTPLPPDMPHLPSLMLTDRGRPITTRAEWLKQRQKIKQQWQSFLGEFPRKKAPLKTQVLATEKLPSFKREHIQYQIEQGIFEDGYLLTPVPDAGKLAAVVVFHPTTPLQAKGVASVDLTYKEELRQGLQLVQKGYLVFRKRH